MYFSFKMDLFRRGGIGRLLTPPKMTRRLTTETFIQRGFAVHGEKYDYSRVVYAGKDKKVKIVCTTHGEFSQTPHNHTYNAQGCPKCGDIARNDGRMATLESVLSKFRLIHGDTFDYSGVVYIGTNEHVTIICRIHGEFRQTPHSHIDGHGCVQCSASRRGNARSRETADVVLQFTEVHGDRYDYSQTIYSPNKKCTIVCREHGEFLQMAGAHIAGQGCPVCGRSSAHENTKLQNEEVIERFQKIHGDRYSYPDFEYGGQHTDVTILCRKHGVFHQSAHGHGRGQGCPRCSHRISRPQAEWLGFVSISHPDLRQEVKIGTSVVDGLYGTTVLEYNGCYFHGCPTCYKDRHAENLKCKQTMNALFQKTKERTTRLVANGYRVIEVWDHEWKRAKDAVIQIQRAFRAAHPK